MKNSYNLNCKFNAFATLALVLTSLVVAPVWAQHADGDGILDSIENQESFTPAPCVPDTVQYTVGNTEAFIEGANLTGQGAADSG